MQSAHSNTKQRRGRVNSDMRNEHKPLKKTANRYDKNTWLTVFDVDISQYTLFTLMLIAHTHTHTHTLIQGASSRVMYNAFLVGPKQTMASLSPPPALSALPAHTLWALLWHCEAAGICHQTCFQSQNIHCQRGIFNELEVPGTRKERKTLCMFPGIV